MHKQEKFDCSFCNILQKLKKMQFCPVALKETRRDVNDKSPIIDHEEKVKKI